jgi:hypothetical protein
VAVRFVLAGDVRLDGASACVLPEDGRGLRLAWDAGDAALDVWYLEDDELEAVWGPVLTRLTLTTSEPVGRCRVVLTAEEPP